MSEPRPPEPSLATRWASKVGAHAVRLLTSVVTSALVPRALGPAAYGDLGFLTSFFTQAFGMFEAGTRMALFTKRCQRPDDAGLLRAYERLLLVAGLAVAAGVAAAYALGAGPGLWPGQRPAFVAVAAALAFAGVVAGTLNLLVDAHGLTTQGEAAKAAQALVGAALLAPLALLGWLDLPVYFACQALLTAFVAVAWWRALRRAGVDLLPGPLPPGAARAYGRELLDYAGPLVVYGVLSQGVGLFDRWLLQRCGGSTEQGFFALGQQVGALCFVLTGALQPLFMRELARAHEADDREALRALFAAYVPRLYAVTAVFTLFAAVNADRLIPVVWGERFQGATLPAALLCLYPLHQTYGQLSGSLLYATGRTRLYAALGLSTSLLSLPLTVYLVGPRAWGGLDLAATGLAVKLLIVQLVGVELQLLFNARALEVSVWPYLGHQVAAAGAFGALALAGRALGGLVGASPAVSLAVSAGAYAAGTVLLVVAAPGLFATTRGGLRALLPGRGAP